MSLVLFCVSFGDSVLMCVNFDITRDHSNTRRFSRDACLAHVLRIATLHNHLLPDLILHSVGGLELFRPTQEVITESSSALITAMNPHAGAEPELSDLSDDELGTGPPAVSAVGNGCRWA